MPQPSRPSSSPQYRRRSLPTIRGRNWGDGILSIVKKAEIIAEVLKSLRGREAGQVDGNDESPVCELGVMAQLEKRLHDIAPDIDLPK